MQPHGSFAILRHGRAINYESIGGRSASDVVPDQTHRILAQCVSNEAKTEAKVNAESYIEA